MAVEEYTVNSYSQRQHFNIQLIGQNALKVNSIKEIRKLKLATYNWIEWKYIRRNNIRIAKQRLDG